MGNFRKCQEHSSACKTSVDHFGRGLTLLEVIIVMVLFSIVAAGIGVATQALAKAPAAADQEQAISMEIISELETYRTVPFATLAANTAISNTINLAINGTTRSFAHTVTFLPWDPNDPINNLLPQSDFLQVRVTIADRTAFLWVTKP